jgi:hypothetical protein
VSRDSDWLVPLAPGGAPAAYDHWAWSELTLLPASATRYPPPRHRAILHVVCPGHQCGQKVGRVDVPIDDFRHPTLVTWLERGRAGMTVVEPTGDRSSDEYWVGRFALVRDGRAAPARIWFSTTCPTHGPVEIRLASVWAAVRDDERRPTSIVATVHPYRRAMI